MQRSFTGNFVCSVCRAKFCQPQELKMHLQEKNHYISKKSLFCHVCRERFVAYEAFQAHLAQTGHRTSAHQGAFIAACSFWRLAVGNEVCWPATREASSSLRGFDGLSVEEPLVGSRCSVAC
eukprot:TRINITY_DN12037_c0_g1_i1.p1 TRINITY_DN12037_c0_g1~~TRINITY_DN12037_c0_g1_i1.p1  ORF type:complete len:122 (+),score=8.96 TRINITY_DN12037_c0_g1_i1:54-419(+)